ncbi:AAA family ATPase [Herbaspirillum sp. HC18]|nr:AAA family ATPase [Herbaspirillum sp. HC18]
MLPTTAAQASYNTADNAAVSVRMEDSPPKPGELQPGNYPHNLEIFRQIWDEATTSKRGLLAEAAANEGKNFLVSLTTAAITTTLIYFVSQYVVNKPPSQNDSLDDNELHVNNLIRFIESGTNIVIATALTNAINQMAQPIGNLLRLLLTKQRGAAHQARVMRLAAERIKEKSEPLLKGLPEQLRERFDMTYKRLLSDIDKMEQGGASIGGGISYPEIENLFYRLNLFLSYPTKTENMYQMGKGGDPAKAHAIGERQKALVDSYKNPRIGDPLNDLINSARLASSRPQAEMPVAFFTGPPATGKTHCVIKLGEVLDAQVVPMTIKEFLIYTGEERDFPMHDSSKKDIERIPEPHQNLIKSPDNNAHIIAFIDEVNLPEDFKSNPSWRDKLKMALLKPANKYAPIPALGTPPLVRPLMVAICSNHGLDFKDPALTTRFSTVIEFPNWTNEGLRERVNEHVESSIAKLESNHEQEVVDCIADALRSLVPFIIETISELNGPDNDRCRVSFRDAQNAINKATANLALAKDVELHLQSNVTAVDVEPLAKAIADSFHETAKKADKANGSSPDKGKKRAVEHGLPAPEFSPLYASGVPAFSSPSSPPPPTPHGNAGGPSNAAPIPVSAATDAAAKSRSPVIDVDDFRDKVTAELRAFSELLTADDLAAKAAAASGRGRLRRMTM